MVQRKLDNWIKQYMRYSASSEAPDKFHFWAAISAIAGALRRRTWIDMGYFQWTPNFYIVFVAPPGVISKSTTASIAMRLLREVPGVQFGPDSVTWQSLAQELANSTETFMIGEQINTMSALTISSSEFGTFLDPEDRSMIDFLVSLWDGQVGSYKKSTKTQGSEEIPNPWINVLACTTPDWIAGNFPEYMIGGGFTSRCIFVYGNQKRHLNAYPKKTLDPDHDKLRQELIHDLECIATEIEGEMQLTDEAIKFGEKWYVTHNSSKPAHLNNDRFGGYLARKQTHIHKLAMVLSAAESSAGIITEEHLATADAIVSELEKDMPRVFSNIGRHPTQQLASNILGYIRSCPKAQFPRRAVYQHFFDVIEYKQFTDIIQNLCNAGFLEITNESGEPTLRIPHDQAVTEVQPHV